MEREQIHVWLPTPLKAALDAEAVERGTNKSVLLAEILSSRYSIEVEHPEHATRRKTPHGGGKQKVA